MRGGKREGAGRKPGSKTRKSAEAALEAAKDGLTPLAHMLNILRDPTSPDERKDWAAEKAAPYMHPRLQTTTLQGDKDKPVKHAVEIRIIDSRPD